ncbi:hypothetical protein HNP86_001828 [Methanococcus maripaludis]|uniref:MoxR-like ATPase n=1 Tax=Methanococcus maripaludis TaxID=39152 RepID=A0A7J9NVH2_METMI|nr:hypothetical protein [Methanococcus maripaludis]MBA2851669.1 hypothetical protein [Methanococcus maripaludis]
MMQISLKDMATLIEEADTVYKSAAQCANPMLFLGEPGIGKSSIVKETAMKLASKAGKKFVDFTLGKEVKIKCLSDGEGNETYVVDETAGSMNIDLIQDIMKNPDDYYVFVDIRLTTVEPSDIGGIPRLEPDYFINVPPIWAKLLSLSQGMLFLDELTIVQRDEIFAAAFMIIQDRKTAFAKFRDDVVIVSAGNADTSSSIARMLPAPLINRFGVFTVKAPSHREWLDYIGEKYDENKCAHQITSFITMNRGDKFAVTPPAAETLENFPTPRTWEMFLKSYNEKDSQDLIHAKCEAYLGPAVAEQFVKYVLIFDSLSLEDLLNQPELIKTFDFDKKFAAMSILGAYINNQKTEKKIIEAAQRVEKVIAVLSTENGYEEYLFYLLGVAIAPVTGNRKSKRMVTQKALAEINPAYTDTIIRVLSIVNVA